MQVAFSWSLCLSVGVVLLSIIPLTIGRVKAGYSVENMSAPRALFDELPYFGKRAVLVSSKLLGKYFTTCTRMSSLFDYFN